MYFTLSDNIDSYVFSKIIYKICLDATLLQPTDYSAPGLFGPRTSYVTIPRSVIHDIF